MKRGLIMNRYNGNDIYDDNDDCDDNNDFDGDDKVFKARE